MLPRVEPVTAPGGGGRAPAPRPASARPRAWRDGASTPPRRSSRSTACAPIARDRRHRGSTGPRWPAAVRWSSAGSWPSWTRPRSWCWTAPRRRARRRSTWPCVRPARSACTWRARPAARSCCRASAARWRSGTTWAPGPPCTCVSRSPSRDHSRRPPRSPRAAAPCSGSPRPISRAFRAALERLPAGARFVVSPNAPRGASVAFEVAGCSGFRLGRAGQEAGRMSGALAPPLPHGGGTARTLAGTRSAAPARDTFALRLATFTALAAFGAGHWAGLVTDASVGRTLLQVAAVSAGAAALGLLGRARLPRRTVLAPRHPHHHGDVRRRARRGRPVAEAAGPARLGRARRRAHTGHGGHPDDRLALRGPRRVDPPDDPPRRAGADGGGRGARILPGAGAARACSGSAASCCCWCCTGPP